MVASLHGPQLMEISRLAAHEYRLGLVRSMDVEAVCRIGRSQLDVQGLPCSKRDHIGDGFELADRVLEDLHRTGGIRLDLDAPLRLLRQCHRSETGSGGAEQELAPRTRARRCCTHR